ncbi:MAG: hypothetical protein H6Q74_176 [Firmicutes bacterium]|nr:hypothetical protein [Bacillota bacterium]
MNLVVTTIYKPSASIEQSASELAQKLAAPLVKREKNSLETISNDYATANILVVTKTGPVVHTPDGQYFFHINMAELRINNLINGKHDHMVAALGITAGDRVLDCTLGLGSDAIVVSYVVGKTGLVVGMETTPLIATVTALGLQQYNASSIEVTSAMRRITVETADYNDYLDLLPDNSFDVVYFDPMFRIPVYSSSNLKPLRTLADHRPLSLAAVTKARRVARRRVVVKETKNSKEFARLGMTTVLGGKYSRVHYGVLEVGC